MKTQSHLAASNVLGRSPNPTIPIPLGSVLSTMKTASKRKKWCFGLLLCALVVFHFSGTYHSRTENLNYVLDTVHETSAQQSLSGRLTSAMLEAITTLSPQHVSRFPSQSFRRLLVREKVGLHSSFYPETFWENRVLPRLKGRVNIVDVGANAGQFAVPNAREGHHVFSFEPNAATCEQLKSNLLKEDLLDKVLERSQFLIFFRGTFSCC